MSNKTLFNAIEAELRNARAALNNAGRYLDAIRVAMDTIVASEAGEGFIPLGLDTEDESIVYGLKVKGVNMDRETMLKLI
jgi:hypothetical protein